MSISTVGSSATRTSFSIGLLVACLFLPFLSRAQSPESNNTVSVRELSIPYKAHEAFEQGAKLLAKKDAEGSLRHFQHAVAEYAGYYEAFYEMGVADLKLWRIEDAEPNFRRAIDVSGEQYAPPLLGLGAILVYQKKFVEAEGIIRKGLNLDPDSWSGRYYLASALFGLDRAEEAEKSARESLRLKADSTEVLRLLADIHSRKKDYRALIDDLDEYLKLDPDSPTGVRVKALRDGAQRALGESLNTTALAQSHP